MAANIWRTFSPPRPLTSNESAILRGLADHAQPADREAALCQVEHALVAEDGPEECGALVFAVDPETCPRVAMERGDVSSALAHVDDGGVYELILLVKNGYIDDLVVYRRDHEPCQGLPQADRLTYLDD
jgi:hypothetical protein